MEHDLPSTSIEQLIVQIWEEALGIDRVGAEDDFFELGGHSLLAVAVAVRIQEALGFELSLEALFDAPTVRELGALVERIKNNSSSL
jgi:acyl carrier protein